jgi:hypothetical protein
MWNFRFLAVAQVIIIRIPTKQFHKYVILHLTWLTTSLQPSLHSSGSQSRKELSAYLALSRLLPACDAYAWTSPPKSCRWKSNKSESAKGEERPKSQSTMLYVCAAIAAAVASLLIQQHKILSTIFYETSGCSLFCS